MHVFLAFIIFQYKTLHSNFLQKQEIAEWHYDLNFL